MATFAAAGISNVAPTPATAGSKDPVPPPLASTGASTVGVPAGFADWNAVYAFQGRLDAAAEQILAAGGADNASIIAAPDSHQLQVYWKGQVPAQVRTMAATLDVPVVFLPARYTHNELVDQAKKVAGDPRVFDAAPAPDGSGVAVTTDAATARAATTGAPTRSAESGPTDLQAIADVPLTITAGSPAQPTFSRQADTPAFYGGSRYNSAGLLTIACTNGIPFGRTQVQILSAAHCSNDGQAANIPGQPTPTGTVSSSNFCRDTNVIFYPAGSIPRTYTGPSDSSASVEVLGATPDFVGNLVATSGATTGEHKNITVKMVDQFVRFSGVGSCPAGTDVVGPMTYASYSDATCAVGDGDSGGPVYAYVGANVVGRGTISSGHFGTATCPNTSSGSRDVYYAPLFRPAGDREIGTLDFYRASPPAATAFDLNGLWTAGTGPSPFFRVNDTNITVDMSAFGRPNATGTISGTTSITVTFPDDRTYTGTLSGNQIRWSNNSVWTKLAPPTIFELDGKWTAGTGPGPFFRLNGNSITVDMSAFGRPNATGTVLNPTTISLTFPDAGLTTTGRLSAPNNISWSNGTLWNKL